LAWKVQHSPLRFTGPKERPMSVATFRDWPAPLLFAARLVSFAVICGVLYWAQAVLIPLALAGLVTFLLSPLVSRLDRLGVPRVAGVLLATGLVTGVIFGVGYVVAGQLGNLAAELPTHRQNIRAKIRDLRDFTRGGAIESVQETIEDISAEVEGGEERPAPDRGREEQPLRVAIEPERRIFGDTTYIGPVLEAAATAGLTMLLSIFMLINREDLRNRLVSLAGRSSLVVTTKAFADAGQRISRYLLMQFVINATMGVSVGIGLYLIGVPYAALWGLAAGVLRYVPYVGPWVAAVMPITISIVTAPGWEQVAIVVALFVALELFSNNVMEPWLYGQSVGLSSIAVIVAAIFWTWLWGPVGLVIATPITAVLVVLSRYIPELGIFDRLLSERPALQRHLWLYQRLLARDDEEAEDIIERHHAEHSLLAACELILGALLALKRDLAAGRIAIEDGEFVVDALSEAIDDLPPDEAADRPPPQGPPVRLIGVPARDRRDEVALELVKALLRGEHATFEILSSDMLIGETIEAVERQRPAAVIIPSLPPAGLSASRHMCKRLKSRLPELRMLVARLHGAATPERSGKLLELAGCDRVAGSLEELRDSLRQIVRNAQLAEKAPAQHAAALAAEVAAAR
jgi:predicted PurR-regulated permease PerM